MGDWKGEIMKKLFFLLVLAAAAVFGYLWYTGQEVPDSVTDAVESARERVGDEVERLRGADIEPVGETGEVATDTVTPPEPSPVEDRIDEDVVLTVAEPTVTDFEGHIWSWGAPGGLAADQSNWNQSVLYRLEGGTMTERNNGTNIPRSYDTVTSCADRTPNAKGSAYLIDGTNCWQLQGIDADVAKVDNEITFELHRLKGDAARQAKAAFGS